MATLPFLPGYAPTVPQKQRHHKPHLFDVKQGIRVTSSIYDSTQAHATNRFNSTGNDADLSIAQTSAEFDRTQQAPLASEDGLRRVPAWVAFDRKVLRFFAYFKEAVYSSNMENFRIRKCVIYYYLEDHSVHVAEPKEENSGIPQGVFIKRHRIPKSDNQYISLDDLQISAELAIYGRVFRIVDCDESTRKFFRDNGVELGPAEDYPMDPFNQKNTLQSVSHHKIMYPMKEHMEASLGKMMGCDIEGTQRFLKNDRKVLRFYVNWADTDFYGEQKPFIVHYFLADDTVEVLDINPPNCGRDPFPVFLKRQKLPKSYTAVRPDLSRIGWTSDQSVQYYTEEDFRVGSEIELYGRKMFICGVDLFTKQFYMDNFGMKEEEFEFLLLDDPEPKLPEMRPPPHNGFGSEEDSLGSFLYLNPKVPKVNFKQQMENDKLTLSFLAKFVDPKPEDAERLFNVKFFMNNYTLSMFEKFKRNSGFVGGKFLERMRIKNPDTECFFEPKDFQVGKVLTINKQKFELLSADKWTEKFMENNPKYFPKASTEAENAAE